MLAHTEGGTLLPNLVDHKLFEEDASYGTEDAGPQFFQAGSFQLEKGGALPSVQVAYRTWGELNSLRDNCILVCHAVSGDSNAVGWWDRIVGPGRAIDTRSYFVVCSNALGGCQGTTGPGSLNEGGRPYGSSFPEITIGDMVSVQQKLMASLGVEKPALVVGGSMGGMQALEWARRNGAKRCWMTASAGSHNALQIGFNEVARQAIFRDSNYRGGDYYDGQPPLDGLAVGRMVGHLSYLSREALDTKFGRRRQEGKGDQFQMESYLNYQGDKFGKRFDPNSLVVLTNAIDRYEIDSLQGCTAEFLLTSYSSDFLYPPYQSENVHQMALAAGCKSRHLTIDLPYGHDSFLLDADFQAESLREFISQR